MKLEIHNTKSYSNNASRVIALNAAVEVTLDTSGSNLDRTNVILQRAKHFETYISTGKFRYED